MNKRIKQLAEQAGWDYSKIERRNQTENFDEQKFAELIVRECAEFARQHNLEKADRSHMIHKAIKQHFGVEL
jgi:CO/xanthine dehydrogenase Mo-binding subunit